MKGTEIFMVAKIISLLAAYLIGSINTSIIVSKIMTGDDIRNHGSGNAGATNTLRTVGKLGALFVVIGDALKAVISIVLARLITKNDADAVYIAGMGVVLGHNFPVFFGFKGGKGVLVSLVAMLFADWRIGLVTAAIAIAIMVISRYVSLGSILGAVIFIVMSLIFHTGDSKFVVFSIMLSGLVIYMHRTNIVRLARGTENKTSFKKSESKK